MDPSPSAPAHRLSDACLRLHEAFGLGRDLHPYIAMIGEAARGPYNETDQIHVFLAREPLAREQPLPATWEGYPVVVHLTGPLAPLGAQP